MLDSLLDNECAVSSPSPRNHFLFRVINFHFHNNQKSAIPIDARVWYQESVFVVKIMLFLCFLLTQSHWCIQDAIEHQPLPVGCDAIKWNIDFLGIPVYVDIVGKKNSNVSENLQVIQLCTYRDFIFNHWHHKNIQCFKYKVTLWLCGAWIISIAKLHWHGY